MLQFTFPDGSIKEFPEGITGFEIAQGISPRLAREALGIILNGHPIELNRTLESGGELRIVKWEDKEGKQMFWHSSAHLLAEALEALYPGIKLGIGPAIEGGFYYDIDFNGKSISEHDLPKIEGKMRELAKKKSEYRWYQISKPEAIKYFEDKGDHLKLDLLQGLEDGEISFCEQGGFTDLCRGGHIPHTGLIKAVKLLSLAGAYWRGDEKNQQLTRIYGVSFPKASLLDEHLAMLEEAKKRDHRKLGKELDIFTFDDDVGSGLPLWLPNGAFLIEQLEDLAKKTEKEAGYQRVRTPHLAKESMYLTSGHLPYYEDSMFPPMEVDGIKYYLKSMNCPHHHKIFAARQRSYREMPMRIAEYGTCYRYEKSGELFGLMRVRSLQMNDAHIYCTREQFNEEFRRVNDMYLKYFKIFGIDKYLMRLSTHSPEKLGKKYVDEPALWKETEDMVRNVLIESGIPYVEIPDEAAFYGPKIDVQVYSAIGREFTLATNQVDFAQGRRFNLSFTNAQGEEEIPLIVHRAPLGTHERFIGFLIEHYAGNFPTWLAPVQIEVLPISDKFMGYAEKVCAEMEYCDIRVSIDRRGEKIGRKIRDAEVKKVPYMLIIGEKEESGSVVSVRRHGEGDLGQMSVSDLISRLKEEILIINS